MVYVVFGALLAWSLVAGCASLPPMAKEGGTPEQRAADERECLEIRKQLYAFDAPISPNHEMYRCLVTKGYREVPEGYQIRPPESSPAEIR